jgi:hypothetical protein
VQVELTKNNPALARRTYFSLAKNGTEAHLIPKALGGRGRAAFVKAHEQQFNEHARSLASTRNPPALVPEFSEVAPCHGVTSA